ncbi:unnamed protein product [Rotaria socialis]
MMPESDVCRLETVAELDTGSSELGLPSEPRSNSTVRIRPFTITLRLFFGETVPVHELKHTPRVLLGMEPAQRLKIDVDWIHSKVILPRTAYTNKVYLIALHDLFNLFEPDGHMIKAIQ